MIEVKAGSGSDGACLTECSGRHSVRVILNHLPSASTPLQLAMQLHVATSRLYDTTIVYLIDPFAHHPIKISNLSSQVIHTLHSTRSPAAGLALPLLAFRFLLFTVQLIEY